MQPEKHQWPLNQALAVAAELIRRLTPACARIALAGSTRRKTPTVGDIELLAIPLFAVSQPFPVQQTFFRDEQVVMDRLNDALDALREDGTMGLRPNARGGYTYGPLNKLLVHLPTGIPVDIFSTTAENWGMAYMVRTGSKHWNIRMMARFKAMGMKGHAYGGVTDQHGRTLPCPTEEEVFRLLGVPFVPPEARF
jgi:DNA polymerase (family 10)